MDPGSSHQGSCSRPNSGPFRVAYIARLLVLLLLVVRHTLARRIIFYSKVTFNGRLVIAARVTIKIPKILIRACDRAALFAHLRFLGAFTGRGRLWHFGWTLLRGVPFRWVVRS